jgi:hypothetical protein
MMLRLADELSPVGRLIGPPPFIVLGPFQRRTVKVASIFIWFCTTDSLSSSYIAHCFIVYLF